MKKNTHTTRYDRTYYSTEKKAHENDSLIKLLMYKALTKKKKH